MIKSTSISLADITEKIDALRDVWSTVAFHLEQVVEHENSPHALHARVLRLCIGDLYVIQTEVEQAISRE